MWALGRIVASMTEGDQMLIFTNTKRMVDMLGERLDRQGVDSPRYTGTWHRTRGEDPRQIQGWKQEDTRRH